MWPGPPAHCSRWVPLNSPPRPGHICPDSLSPLVSPALSWTVCSTHMLSAEVLRLTVPLRSKNVLSPLTPHSAQGCPQWPHPVPLRVGLSICYWSFSSKDNPLTGLIPEISPERLSFCILLNKQDFTRSLHVIFNPNKALFCFIHSANISYTALPLHTACSATRLWPSFAPKILLDGDPKPFLSLHLSLLLCNTEH